MANTPTPDLSSPVVDPLDASRAPFAARIAEDAQARAALEAFVTFTAAVGSESNVLTLAQQAVDLLHSLIPHQTIGYYELDGGRWKVRAWSTDLTPEILTQLQLGVPEDAPDFAQAARSGSPRFVDGWDAVANQASTTAAYGAAAFLPLVVHGVTLGLLSAGTRQARVWMAWERGLVQSVAHGLTLALERAENLRTLQRQNHELDARTQALAAFAQFTEAAGHIDHLNELTSLALETLKTLIPGANVAFTARTSTHWQLLRTSDNLDPALLAMAQTKGFPLDTPVFADLVRTGQPSFVNGWDETVQDVPHTAQFQSVAHYPIQQEGQVVAALGVAVTDQASWTPIQQAIIRSVGLSFTLLYDRIAAAELMHTQNEVLAARSAALEQANRQLKVSTEELEAFNYSVSHDLMTPVRHVTGFSQLAQRHVTDAEKVRRYLTLVEQGAAQLETLIEAMLTLSRTGRRDLRMGLVDLGLLVTQARQDVRLGDEERVIEWRVGALPLVTGDREGLRQVLGALLSNAVKFTRRQADAVIEVWAEEAEGTVTIFVRDNGVGFDPRYGGRLFSMFQRLHRVDEFDGLGVGLALVRRIVARHGGTVQATGEVGRGATFSVTLPQLDEVT